MNRIKIGLLPLYLKLYDDVLPSMRQRIDAFTEKIQQKLEGNGLEIMASPVCREKKEFDKAISLFDDACAVITLHLSYSPSLESIDSLVKFNKPIIVLDTTPSYSFDVGTHSDEILYNHGIHGVQDMCNTLKRRGVEYYVAAGHWDRSDVIDRVVGLCKAAYASHIMKTSRVGLIGSSFKGMGDFFVPQQELKDTIGCQVVPFDLHALQGYSDAITEEEIQAEMKADLILFKSGAFSSKTHRRTVRMNLVVRKWLENHNLDAYTFNFSDIERSVGFETVPFIEACKAMSRGIGYAGEGDILTAALCGALLQISPDTSFTEMFCPDWKGSSIFLSHMGEMNIRTAKGKMELVEKEYPYSDVDAPLMVNGCFKPGSAVLVNLAPMGEKKYTLILSKVSVIDIEGDYDLKKNIHGWVRPELPLPLFLEKYSQVGGTHHLVLVYGEVLESLMAFGKMMGFDIEVL